MDGMRRRLLGARYRVARSAVEHPESRAEHGHEPHACNQQAMALEAGHQRRFALDWHLDRVATANKRIGDGVTLGHCYYINLTGRP
jgi:hypothetical protein